MILQALVAHYEDLLKQGKISSPGWGKVKVSFRLELDDAGNMVSLLPLRTAREMGKKTVYLPQTLEVPQPVKRSADINPNFLCDNSSYIFGADKKGKANRTQQCFQACKELHQKLLGGIHISAGKAIFHFFENWNPLEAVNHELLLKNWEDLAAGGNILFYYQGKPVTEDEEIRKVWQAFYDDADGSLDGICMVTGKRAKTAKLHPTIKGVRGAQAMGTSLVSFNAPAFCSYGKEQGSNASVSEYAAFAYATALNELLNDGEHTRTIGDTTVVCWAEGGDKIYQDAGIAAMFGVEEDSGITEQDLSLILENIRQGRPVELNDEILDAGRKFYILGLAPNAARLSVRFFTVNSFGNMLKNIGDHYKRLEIVRPAYDEYQDLPVWKLLFETVNKNARDKTPSPQMAADTLQAIISGSTYPASLLNGVMLRIRAEHEVTRGRAAIIKAFYLKNMNKGCPEEVLQMELNDKSTNVPYALGRLFAVLEHIQQEANPGINATIKDKYFNSAASTPAQIFPILMNLAQKHLRKLNEAYKISFNKQIQDILENLGTEYPKRMTLPEQGAFHLGYYHQTQKRYQKKEEK